MNKLLLALSLFSFFFVACAKEEDPIFTISQTSIAAQASENSTTIILNANNPWSVSFPDWCTVSPSSGDGKGEINVVITVKKNNSFVERECSLIFVSRELEASITVIQDPKEIISYVDEYGVNHGKGVLVGNTVWAPVNCGYKASTAADKGYPYGKLYQWGRKYGQGYSKEYDATAPYDDGKIIQGPVELSVGQNPSNQENFYTYDPYVIRIWVSGLTSSECSKLWNNGTEESPIKTNYDPCPTGWRVPTKTEWMNLYEVSRPFFAGQQTGCYHDDLLILAGGYSNGYTGVVKSRIEAGRYWSSSFNLEDNRAYQQTYGIGKELGTGTVGNNTENCANGNSVRCVME